MWEVLNSENDVIYELPNGDVICEECYYDNYSTCCNCGDVFHNDDAYHNGDGDCYCEDCYDEGCGGILSYHSFNDWKLHKKDDEDNPPFYIGFELEIDGDYDVRENEKEASDIVKNELNCICMHDGSLNNGFEIISHPQSYNYIMENIEKYKNVFEKLVALNYRSHDTSNCGLHFHITRPKSNEVIDRLWLILETYKNEICAIARRSNNHYAQWLSDYGSYNNNDLKSLYFIKKINKNSTRYLALNNENSRTIELRFCKGTLKYETFFASIQFINNLMIEASNISKEVTDITWNDLIKGEYIHRYCDEKNIFTDKKIIDNSLKFIERDNKIKSIAIEFSKKCYELIKNQMVKNTIDFTIAKNTSELINIYATYKSINKISEDILERLQMIENAFNDEDYFITNSGKSSVYRRMSYILDSFSCYQNDMICDFEDLKMMYLEYKKIFLEEE